MKKLVLGLLVASSSQSGFADVADGGVRGLATDEIGAFITSREVIAVVIAAAISFATYVIDKYSIKKEKEIRQNEIRNFLHNHTYFTNPKAIIKTLIHKPIEELSREHVYKLWYAHLKLKSAVEVLVENHLFTQNELPDEFYQEMKECMLILAYAEQVLGHYDIHYIMSGSPKKKII